MKSFRSNHISQSPVPNASSSYHCNTLYGLDTNKENFYKISSFGSNPSMRRDILSDECIHNWESSLDKELNKILRETLNGNKENRNSTLVDHSIRKLKELYDDREGLDITKLLLADIAELLSLEIPNIETKNRAVGNYSIPQFLELVETNHLLMTKVNEMQKAINIFNIKKSVVIHRMQKRLENAKLTSNQEAPSCNQTIDNNWTDFISTNRITKQEKSDNTHESLSLTNSLNSDSVNG